MQDKQDVLAALQSLSAQGQVTQEEVLAAFTQGTQAGYTSHQDDSLFHKLSVAEITYYIGSFIVFLGIVILLGQNWDSFDTLVKVLVTFGASMVALLVGVMFGRDKRTAMLAQPFYLISNLVFPVGIYQLFAAFGYEVTTAWDFSLIFTIVSIWFFAAYWIFDRLLFLFFGIFAATILYFSFIQAALAPTFYGQHLTDLYEYSVLVIGVVYGLLAYGFSQITRVKPLSSVLYGFGILAILGAGFALQGFMPQQNIFWELIYPLLAIGSMFASTSINQRSLLILGALALMAYIIKITSEYFSQDLGWPLALVVCGFAFIGVGYCTYYLNKKYFKKDSTPLSPPLTPGPTV